MEKKVSDMIRSVAKEGVEFSRMMEKNLFTFRHRSYISIIVRDTDEGEIA